ncbi:MAG: hypothetical protein ABIZ81_18185 [Opitutaceae bacterium]
MIFLRLVLWIWFFSALGVGHFLLLQRLPPLAIQGIIFGLTTLLLLAYFRVEALRRAIDELPVRALVFFHVTRFVGFYFLHLYSLGELPYEFAVPGGYGDIIIATLALAVLFIPMPEARRSRAIYIWNVIGLVDILLVLFSAVRLGRDDPSAMRALTYLPLSLLPTFLVPAILASHVIIFRRLKKLPAAP